MSRGCGQAAAVLGECAEDREEVAAVFGRGGEIAANGAEFLGSGEGPQASGDESGTNRGRRLRGQLVLTAVRVKLAYHRL